MKIEQIQSVDLTDKGGGNNLDNYQPMCQICNTLKGNGEEQIIFKKIKDKNNYTKLDINVGDLVFRKKINKRGKFLGYSEFGILDKFIINSFTNKQNIMIVGNDTTMIDLRKIYKILN